VNFIEPTATSQDFESAQYSYSTAEIEDSVFYGAEHRPLSSPFTTISTGQVLSVVNIAGSFFVVDEQSPAPWQPLGPSSGLVHLADPQIR
jgi:hypothetical protein